MNKKITPFVENVTEAAAACLFTMVQGNILALTMAHWLIASQTGLFAGVIAAAAIIFAKINRPWVISLVLGVATAAVDFLIHEGSFGPLFLEAVVTGLGAAVLSFLVGKAVRSLRSLRAASA
jgi:hypothetical protein